VEVPPPVFIASVEYESLKDKQNFDQACAILTREDPSLVSISLFHDVPQFYPPES